MHSSIKKQMLNDDRREVEVDFFQGPTVTPSTGPNAAKFGSYYKYMNAAALSKRNEVMTLVSSKAFTGQYTACQGEGEGGSSCVNCIEYRPFSGITRDVYL